MLSIYLQLGLPSCLPFRVSDQNPSSISYLSHACYVHLLSINILASFEDFVHGHMNTRT